MKNEITVYQLTRQEYKKEFTWVGIDSEGEDIIQTKLIYTGKETKLLHTNKNELLKCNSIPEWKAEITNKFSAKIGHTNGGDNKYLFNGNPITILSII
jgi:hypothetical protein